MDELRSRGLMFPNDEKITEWKHSWLPNLMGSEIGKWMLENNLTEYSEKMNKDLRAAVNSTGDGSRDLTGAGGGKSN